MRSNRTRSPAAQHRVRNHLVGRARAVQDEVGLVGAEHLRRISLCLGSGPLVNQKIAEIDVGIAQVVAKNALSKMLEEELTCRRLSVELAALMPWAREVNVGLAVVGHKPAKERRQQRLPVLHKACHDLLGIERRGLLAEVDVAIDLAGEVEDGHVRDAVRIRKRPERGAKADGSNRARQFSCKFQPLAVDQCNIGTHRGIFGHIPVKGVADLDFKILVR